MSAEEQEQDAVEALPALRELVQSAGWQLLKAQALAEWGPAGYGREMQRALASVPVGPDRPYELARIAEQVDNTAKAVNALIRWPDEEIKKLAPAKKPSRWMPGVRGVGR